MRLLLLPLALLWLTAATVVAAGVLGVTTASGPATGPPALLLREVEDATRLASDVPASAALDAYCEYNGLPGVCQEAASCNGTRVAGLCGGEGPAEVQCCVRQDEHRERVGCGSAAVRRAMNLVNVKLQYCQAAYHERDYSESCADICERHSNPFWDKYRSDCSALISYALGLSTWDGGLSTYHMAPYDYAHSYNISVAELRPGDSINSIPRGHVMLFSRWLDAERSRLEFIEEPGCSHSEPHARISRSECHVDQDGLLYVVEKKRSFLPIRFHAWKDC